MTRALLRDPRFRLLLAGQTVTMFGDVALMLVLGIWATELTGSTGVGGAVFLAVLAPMLVAPLLGVLIDRFPRRQVMIANDLATAAVLLPLLLVHDRGDVWLLFAVGAAYGLSQQVFFAARSALLRSMLEDEQLGSANAVLESLRQALKVAGPAVGAALFAKLGGGAVALLDAGTFVAAAGLLLLLKVPDTGRARRGERSLAAELGGGVRHIRETPVLMRMLTALCAAAAVLGVLQVAGLALVEDGLHRPTTFLGVVFTFEGLGSIAGGLAAPALLRRAGELRLAAVGLAAMALGVALLCTRSVPPVLAGAALSGAGFSALVVGYVTLLQRATAAELQGRVFTAAEAAAGVPYVGMLAVAAMSVALVDYRLMLVAGTVVLVTACAYLAGWRDTAPRRLAPALATRARPRLIESQVRPPGGG